MSHVKVSKLGTERLKDSIVGSSLSAMGSPAVRWPARRPFDELMLWLNEED